MIAGNIGKAFETLVILTVVGVILNIYFIGKSIYNYFTPTVIESKEIIAPKIKLETDGEKIDTLYVYKFK